MPGSLSFSVGDGTADATMTFTGTKAAVNTALNGLSFNPTTSFTGTASLQVVTSDQGATGTGGTLTDNDTVDITVINPRPVVTATVANLNYTENDSATVLDSLITVTDADSNITGATISITTGYVIGEGALAVANQLGITGSWSSGTGVLTLSGTTTPANYQTVMRTITYVNSSENPATGNRNVNFVASDAVGASNTASRQVAVTAVNDAPVNTVPGTQTTAVNTAEVFTGGSLISIADVDASSADMQVQLVSTNGTSTLSPLTGAVVLGRRRHGGRHDDVRRNGRRGQRRPGRAELHAESQLGRRGQPADRHQRPGQHRHRRHLDRRRHGQHHRHLEPWHLRRHLGRRRDRRLCKLRQPHVHRRRRGHGHRYHHRRLPVPVHHDDRRRDAHRQRRHHQQPVRGHRLLGCDDARLPRHEQHVRHDRPG